MTTLLKKAREFALKAHAGQRYEPFDYGHHLNAVVEVLQRFGIQDERVLAAGWLHDTVEDTEITLVEIKKEFGEDVADMVDAVTDGPGTTREEKKERVYRLIPITRGALEVKLADRIANVEMSKGEFGKARKFTRYAIEHENCFKKLRGQSAEEMWKYLDSLFE